MPDLGRCYLVTDLLRLSLPDSTRGVGQRGERKGSDEFGMNLVVIEEHQVGDLVFAQVDYLYIRLKATSACVIVPIAKVPRTKYSSYQ